MSADLLPRVLPVLLLFAAAAPAQQQSAIQSGSAERAGAAEGAGSRAIIDSVGRM